MLQGIESTTTRMLVDALDGASLRHAVISANIAHHGVEGYVPQRVVFLPSAGGPDGTGLREARVEPAVDGRGHVESGSLDGLVADLGQNAVQYQALARLLDRQLGLLSLAITEGRR